MAHDAGPSLPDGGLDEFYRLIDTLLVAGRDFRQALDRMEGALLLLRASRRPGPPPVALGGAHAREAWNEFSRTLGVLNGAVCGARIEGYRAAVDDGSLTLTELARATGHSRQQVTRLVNKGRAARHPD
ncbi:hypothetical protein ACFVIM_34885 [Streptomyces sp. NPDC057638]|uniref:hypothetical protein n=1 Tax=Streptomyces sp. NPDC057638 TaxID=3346190 RepID=UPI0036908604